MSVSDAFRASFSLSCTFMEPIEVVVMVINEGNH